MRKFQPPEVPFVEANLIGPKQKPTAIVLNLSMTTSEKGAALGIATRLHKHDSPSKSFHYLVDEAETYRGVWDNRAVYASPHSALAVLICAELHEDVPMFEDATAAPVLYRSADLVSKLCLAYHIPARFLDSDEVGQWEKRRTRRRGGIIDRIPGNWPADAFLQDVRSRVIQKKVQHG